MVEEFAMSLLSDHLFMCMGYEVDTITLFYFDYIDASPIYTLAYFGIIFRLFQLLWSILQHCVTESD